MTLSFTFTATAETIVSGSGNGAQGDEAAIRMGIPATLSSFTAGNYPGQGNRTAANDGHFVDLDLFDLGPVPEPDTALLLVSGLALLALQAPEPAPLLTTLAPLRRARRRGALPSPRCTRCTTAFARSRSR